MININRNIENYRVSIVILFLSVILYIRMEYTERCLSEASRTNTYGISFNISPYRKIDGKMFQKYTFEEQCQILLNIFCDEQMNVIGETTDNYVFEPTERGNAHLHAMIERATIKEMKRIQENIDEGYGYKKDPIDRVFHFSVTTLHKSFWAKYMNKHQEVLEEESIPERPFRALFGF